MKGFLRGSEPVRRVIFEALRQRPPFLFIDALDPASQPGTAVAYFTFPAEAPYFSGHFPGDPVVPGVLLVEAMAQTARCALYLYLGVPTSGYLVRVDRCRFQQLVRPGEPLTLHATLSDVNALAAWSGLTVQMMDARCGVFKSGRRVARARITLHFQALQLARREASGTVTRSKGDEA
jgi:3-hydroxyacyl-[acyl-carrier-protein] dehydratase